MASNTIFNVFTDLAVANLAYRLLYWKPPDNLERTKLRSSSLGQNVKLHCAPRTSTNAAPDLVDINDAPGVLKGL